MIFTAPLLGVLHERDNVEKKLQLVCSPIKVHNEIPAAVGFKNFCNGFFTTAVSQQHTDIKLGCINTSISPF